MAVYRVDLLTDEPDPVFEWIRVHVPRAFVVRNVGYHTRKGWYVKSVFKRQNDAEAFHRRWHPESENHKVVAWPHSRKQA